MIPLNLGIFQLPSWLAFQSPLYTKGLAKFRLSLGNREGTTIYAQMFSFKNTHGKIMMPGKHRLTHL